MTFGIGNRPASEVLNGFKMELADIISQFAKHNKIKGHPACPIVPVLGALTSTDAVEIITPAVLLPITSVISTLKGISVKLSAEEAVPLLVSTVRSWSRSTSYRARDSPASRSR